MSEVVEFIFFADFFHLTQQGKWQGCIYPIVLTMGRLDIMENYADIDIG